MIKLQTLEVCGFPSAMYSMRNPMNSWDKADSHHDAGHDDEIEYCIGPNDYKLATKLATAGPVHGKYRRMISVYADIIAPLYWWKEFSTYKVGTVCNSCSTMHKIHEKEFTLDDFSHEHLISPSWIESNNYTHCLSPLENLKCTIDVLNQSRLNYLYCKSMGATDSQKLFWWQMIQLLPSTYNQQRTIMLNYEVLANIYQYRRGHKLDEWRDFIKWSLTLPYSELFTCGAKDDEE